MFLSLNEMDEIVVITTYENNTGPGLEKRKQFELMTYVTASLGQKPEAT